MPRATTDSRRYDLVWITLVCLAAIAGSTGGAAAASDCQNATIQSLCELDADPIEAVKGFGARITDAILGDDPNPSSDATAFQTAANSPIQPIQDWVNKRTTADPDLDVFAFTFEHDGSSSTVYLTADVNGSDYENASVDSSTTRNVDESCTLEDNAVSRADDEVDRFREEFAEPDVDLTREYIGNLAGRYGKNVNCTFNTGG